MDSSFIQILTALITVFGTLIGVWIQNKSTQDKITNELNKQQAVMETKVEELTREVREHNNFALRVPVVENDIKTLYKRVDSLADKLEDDNK